MSAAKRQAPTTSETGWESHPGFAMIGASRVSVSGRGATLFDSDLQHQHIIQVKLTRAQRKRDLHRDWLHPTEDIVEVEMSEAQWASFVSSMNVGSGVPCTLNYVQGEGYVPGLLHSPRLAQSMAEVHTAAADAFAGIQKAMDALEALPANAGAKARREAQSNLRFAIKNATSGVDFAGEQLAEHVENVVQKARADVEAMVVTKATQLGLDPATVASPLVLTEGGDL